MKKNKLLLQIGICLVISFVALYGGKIENQTFAKYYDASKEMVMKSFSREDVTEAWNRMTSALAGAPSKVVSAVTEVNEASKYGQPIDEESTTQMKQVHAVAGGVVLKSGKNEEYGLYIQIKHEGAVSIYGNLSSVGVVESERIQRGEIIGSYDTLSETEFYYELRENL